MGIKKRFFAHTSPGKVHKARYFHTLDEIRVWIVQKGGGTIKMRDSGTIGIDLGGASFDPPLKGTIEIWPATITEKNTTAVPPLQQTFLDIRADTALLGHNLGEFEPVEVTCPTLFRAYCQICSRSVEVTQKGVIYSLLGSGRCYGHE